MFKILLSCILSIAAFGAQAQAWPAKPVRFVVAFAPGGSLDFVTRTIADHGDVAVWGGPSRLRFHGVMPLKDAQHRSLGACRFNLTFRRAG